MPCAMRPGARQRPLPEAEKFCGEASWGVPSRSSQRCTQHRLTGRMAFSKRMRASQPTFLQSYFRWDKSLMSCELICGCSSYPTLVDRRAGVALKALAQFGDQYFVDHELTIIVGNLVGSERLKAFRRRHVYAGRERAHAALLLLGEEPGEIKLRCIRMRRILEDAAGEREYRRLVNRRPHNLQLSLALEWPDRRGGVESGDVLAGGYAARDGKVALDEGRLRCHVLVHPAPAVFLHDQVKEIERCVIIGRIYGDHPPRKHGLEEILRRFRRILRADLGGVVGISERVGAQRHVSAILVAKVRQDLIEALWLEHEQLALLLPGGEVLDSLEEGHVDL